MEVKQCTKCKEVKSVTEFDKDKSKKSGLISSCKTCRKQQSKQYRIKNKEKIKEYSKQYDEKNKEKINQYGKQWRKENKEYHNEYHKQYQFNKRKTDLIFKFKCNVRTSIRNSFKRGKNNYTKKLRSEQILGCDIDFFRKYIESKFSKGMTFDNHGEWHLDHIIPLATAQTEDDVIKLTHYTNFQPLWAFDNISKGCTINEATQVVLTL